MSKESKSENFLTNGNLINRHHNKLSFKPSDYFFLENESYLGKFLVLSTKNDAGVTFVNATGSSSNGDVVFDLAYLRRQYALGNLKTYDEDGKLQ